MEAIKQKLITPAEYLKQEALSETKQEYYNGEIFAMACAKKNHNLIVSNLIISIGNQIKNSPCVVYPSDMKVMIDEYNYYTYPDVSIVCGKSIFLNTSEDTLINPGVIIEVLSESTEKYDRGKKFEAYRKIPSLQEYVLVASEYKQIDVYTKVDNYKWIFTTPNPNGVIELTSINCILTLESVYEKIDIVLERV